MESLFFKYIFSPLLLIFSEGKNLFFHIPYQLNVCLFSKNIKERKQLSMHHSLPFSFLSAGPGSTEKECSYPCETVFRKRLNCSSLPLPETTTH